MLLTIHQCHSGCLKSKTAILMSFPAGCSSGVSRTTPKRLFLFGLAFNTGAATQSPEIPPSLTANGDSVLFDLPPLLDKAKADAAEAAEP